MARLQRELAEAEKERRRFHTDCEKTLIYYARTDCLQLATMMYDKFPQELREMVYEYLCVDPDRPIPVGPYYHFRPYDRPYVYAPAVDADADQDALLDFVVDEDGKPDMPIDDVTEPHGTPADWGHDELHLDPELVRRISSLHIQQDMDGVDFGSHCTILPDGRVKEEHTHKPASDMVLPSSHLLDPRYVGPAVSYEIQKMYYARNTFSVCSVEKAISLFLGRHTGYSMPEWTDSLSPSYPPDLGAFPPLFAADYIRKLQIRVKLEHYLQDKLEREYIADRYTYEQRFWLKTCMYLRGLKYYLDRRPKGAVEIEFVVMSQLPDLDRIRPRVHYEEAELERDRIYVNCLECIRSAVYTAMYDYDEVAVKVTHYDPTIVAFPRDISRLFAMTKKQWEYVSRASSCHACC